jgi:hypothetical protein
MSWCHRHDQPLSTCDCSLYDDTPAGEYVAVKVKPEPFVCQCFNRDFQKSADELNAKCGSDYTAEDFCGWHVDLCMNTSCGIKKPSTVDDYADLGRRSFPQHLLEWEEQASYDSQGRL